MFRDARLGDKTIKKSKKLINVRIRVMFTFKRREETVFGRGHEGAFEVLVKFYFLTLYVFYISQRDIFFRHNIADSGRA